MTTHRIDALAAPTLKHLREQWWNADFTAFLVDTLRPRSGRRILDVGCGEGLAEIALGRQHISQMRLVGVDLDPDKLIHARGATRAHNMRVGFAAGNAVALPFASGAFDALYCVAVMQYVVDVDAALGEFARVLVAGGRVVCVEPDNAARFLYSSLLTGRRAFDAAERFFRELSSTQAESADGSIGPKIASHLARHRIDPIDVRVFPVSSTYLAPPEATVWASRRRAVERAIAIAATDHVRSLGCEYLDALAAYQHEAETARAAFVEIQNTMLFATVGQKAE